MGDRYLRTCVGVNLLMLSSVYSSSVSTTERLEYMKAILVLLLVLVNVGTIPMVVARADKLPDECYMSVIPVPVVNQVVDDSATGFDRRYKTSKKLPLLITKWTGYKQMDGDKLRATIRAVLQRLPQIRSTPRYVSLVYETMAIESNLGSLGHISVGHQYGSIQMLRSTALEILEWSKKNQQDIYRTLVELRTPCLSTRDNLKQNIPFQIAMCATYYWMRTNGSLPKITTVRARGNLWKRVYNTYKGSGTVAMYITRAREYDT